MKKCILLIIIGLLFLPTYGWGQEEDPVDYEINKIYPVSPQAASLGKYGDIPVNLATGRINYQIPLYTIKEGDIEFPISLSYNSNGLMVSDRSGRVGIGWSINTGGKLIRKINGGADFANTTIPFHHSYIKDEGIGEKLRSVHKKWYPLPGSDSDMDKLIFYGGKTWNGWDTQPDKFSILTSLLNESFYLNEKKQPVFFPYSSTKVNFLSDNLQEGFLVTDDKGFQYLFKDSDEVSSEQYNNTVNIDSYLSSWNLNEIKSLKTNSNILFKYNSQYTFNDQYNSESHLYTHPLDTGSNCENDKIQDTTIETISEEKLLTEIQFSNGVIKFSYDKGLLQTMKIIKNNVIIIEYTFLYKTLSSKKHVLEQIKKIGRNGEEIPFYKFTYDSVNENTNNLNLDDNFKQDYWGYYNGSSNTSFFRNNPNRSINYESALIGMLSKITYPTGGFSEIHYEGNTSFEPREIDNLIDKTETFRFKLKENEGLSKNETFSITLPDDVSSDNQIVNISIEGRWESIIDGEPSAPTGGIGEINIEGLINYTFVSSDGDGENPPGIVYQKVKKRTRGLGIEYLTIPKVYPLTEFPPLYKNKTYKLYSIESGKKNFNVSIERSSQSIDGMVFIQVTYS